LKEGKVSYRRSTSLTLLNSLESPGID